MALSRFPFGVVQTAQDIKPPGFRSPQPAEELFPVDGGQGAPGVPPGGAPGQPQPLPPFFIPPGQYPGYMAPGTPSYFSRYAKRGTTPPSPYLLPPPPMGGFPGSSANRKPFPGPRGPMPAQQLFTPPDTGLDLSKPFEAPWFGGGGTQLFNSKLATGFEGAGGFQQGPDDDSTLASVFGGGKSKNSRNNSLLSGLGY